ncbi:MAG: class I tRNA ligase family protein [Candidatus Aenigmarchaeota archaeon]|nr:class I tRNA ligase family protein [Candidatus Aenigmarchaeota archaeon]
MVIFNPEDKRYSHLKGKTAITPVFGKEVPINAHPMADIEKGTGLVMMCSAGDLSDIRFFREMKLEPVIAINKDGTMNEYAGLLKGLNVNEARKKVLKILEEKKLLVKQIKTTHRTPICERSKDPIEFIAMPEFYLKQIKFKPKMREFAKKINFFSPQSRQILLDWIDSVSIDWPISRRRYYATEIPLWYCKKCSSPVLPPKGGYYRPWKEKPPVKKCSKCGGTEFRGEERVFDTWFDSSISPLYILKWSRDDKFFRSAFPCTLRPSGKEIIRNWGYYTILKCYLLTGKCIFKDHWVNYHVVDEKGKKMSKSKGNVIDPKEILDKFGAEMFRLWTVVEGDLTRTDFRCSDERIEGEGKFLTKLWNISRFISMFPKPKTPGKMKPTETDKWILKEANTLVKLAREKYEKYDFHTPVTKIKHFLWETFASHYIEMVKSRAYNQERTFSRGEQDAALETLYGVLETMLKLLAPVLPFIAYRIYMDIWGRDIHSEKFPVEQSYKTGIPTAELLDINSRIWKAKKDRGLSLKADIQQVTIPEGFRCVGEDLKQAHHIKELRYGKKLEIIL